MATRIHARAGTMKCWSCDHEVPVRKTAGGKLSAPCNWCDFHHYAEPGTIHHKNMLADVTLDAAPPADPPAPPPGARPPAPPPPPPAQKSKGPFGY